jgi:hypothetical protein
MDDKQREALTEIIGYLDAYECGLCGGSEPGQHTEGCPVLELREMVSTPQTLYDWSRVPEWVQWIARDGNHIVYGHSKKPDKLSFCWAVRSDGYDPGIPLGIKAKRSVKWQNSLEARPK